jgi:sporulation protein YlmC with PRC-barrel domain
MKSKFVIPTLAICVGSSLLVGSLRANDQNSNAGTTAIDQKNTVNTSQLIHSRVLDQTGQKIGDVEDIIVDQNTGRAQFAVIKLSGDLADKGKYAPVPFSLLRFNNIEQKDSFGHRDLTLQADRQKLLSASRFSTKNWPDQDHVAWGPEVYSFYGVPWTGASAGAAGSSSSSLSGSSVSTSPSTSGSEVIVQESRPVTRYEYRTGSVDADKPIDNGTGPDGRDTFHFTPRPWPYNETQAGASGSSFSVTTGSSSAPTTRSSYDSSPAASSSYSTTTTTSEVSGDNTRVTVQPDHQVIVRIKDKNQGTTAQNYDNSQYASDTTRSASDSSQYTSDTSRVVIQDQRPATTYRTYEYREYTSDKPIDNGTGPDGRDTFHFTPRPWPYHDLTGAH